MHKLCLVVLIFAAMSFSSCDYVDTPIKEPIAPADCAQFPLVDSNSIHLGSRKVLIEEATGQKCATCPRSSELLIAKQKASSGEIILMATHAGDFADGTPPDYPIDFRTKYGDEWNDLYMRGFGNPTVMVNRLDKNGGIEKAVYTPTQWDAPISDQLLVPTDLGLGIAANYIKETNFIAISVAATAINAINGEHRMVLVCMEDSVVTTQKDNRLDIIEFPGRLNPTYMHRHVTRGALNSPDNIFGDIVIKESMAPNEWFGGEYCFPVPSDVVNPANCTIVAIVVESSSEKVIQSEEVHVQTVE